MAAKTQTENDAPLFENDCPDRELSTDEVAEWAARMEELVDGHKDAFYW